MIIHIATMSFQLGDHFFIIIISYFLHKEALHIMQYEFCAGSYIKEC